MKKITINDGELVIRERVVGYFQKQQDLRKSNTNFWFLSFFYNVNCVSPKQVTKFGNGAKVDYPKDFLGKNVYVIICDE